MISKTTAHFRALLALLPREIQDRARRGYATFLNDSSHPSLHFKQVHPTRPIFSARVGLAHRALCVKNGDVAVWFWIGSHARYDQLLKNLSQPSARSDGVEPDSSR